MPFVVTADQRHSRTQPDRVGEALLSLRDRPALRGFERTAGDELQGVLADGSQVVAVVLALTRLGGFSLGVGVGPVEEPLPVSTREGRGPAFERARAAVERAKKRRSRVAVEAAPVAGGGPTTAPTTGPTTGPTTSPSALDAQAALDVLSYLRARRSPAAWEAADLLDSGQQRAAAAAALGVSRQAVQQRLAATQWDLELDVRRLATRLLDRAHEQPAGQDDQRGTTR